MADPKDRLGSSGVFKAIVDGARKFKRAISEGDLELTSEAQDHANRIAQAFVAGRFADVHAMATPSFQQRTARDSFVARWRDAVRDRGPLTGFAVANMGRIDLGFIPGLEDVPQDDLVAFVQITFSRPDVALDDERAFTIAVVLLDDGGETRVGALHTR